MPTELATAVEDGAIAFRLADPDGLAEAVQLWCDLDLGDTSFGRVEGGWGLDLPLGDRGPAIDRIEYLFDVDGVLGLDPGNPLAVPGAFGEHSWLPLPGYAPPDWLDDEPADGRRAPVSVPGTPVGVVDLEVWSPADAVAGEPLPLLVSHDGPEMDEYGALTRFVSAGIAAGGCRGCGSRCWSRGNATSATPPIRRTPPPWPTTSSRTCPPSRRARSRRS